MVLEVSQAELGRVNIRVAVNQDIVHTHFSSDRGDMGQYLANGQDKLQAALQTSGLDLGQFRVDIDRQSAGRSFQQQPSHDQRPGTHSQGQGQGQGNQAGGGGGIALGEGGVFGEDQVFGADVDALIAQMRSTLDLNGAEIEFPSLDRDDFESRRVEAG